MSNDRLQFRAWCEVPLEDDNGNTKTYGFYLYEINVHDSGKMIGFDENILSDNLSLTSFPETVKEEIYDYFTWENFSNLINYFEVKKFSHIEQCIGIKDKSGKWIYEGDIIRMDADIMCADQQQVGKPCRVEFGDMGFWFVYPQLEGEHKSSGWTECADYEVIGNVHQNKSLLEVENNGIVN